MKLSSNQAKVIQKIRQAKIKEEMAVPLYTSHIKEVLFWSGIADDKKDLIIKNLKTLERESEIHISMLKKVEEIFIKSQE